MNPWILHVKKYALEHNLSYKDAMSKAKPTYKNIQGSGFNDYLKKVTNRLNEREKAENIKRAERNKNIPTRAGSGFGDFLKFTFDKKNYMLENKAKIDKKAADLRAAASVAGSGRRGRPKGSKNKK